MGKFFLFIIVLNCFGAQITGAGQPSQPQPLYKFGPEFPKGCGIFLVKGILHTKEHRIIVWERSVSESKLPYAEDCERCPHMDDMSIEAKVEIKNLNTPAHILEIKAVGARLVSKATLVQSKPCAP